MILLTLNELLSRLGLFLEGKEDFAAVRSSVYQFYEAEESYVLDEPLEEVFPILLAYLQYEEAETDSKRDVRMRRLYRTLSQATSSFGEQTVFALEFDEIRDLTKKFSDQLITEDVFRKQMARLSPARYNVNRLVEWACSHKNEPEPLPDSLR